MFRNSLFTNSIPFNVPNMANNLNTFSNVSKITKTLPKFSFSGILDNASRTVNTINQIIPLYNQVKPMVSNAKTALNIFKNVKNINNEQTQVTSNIDNFIKEEPKPIIKPKEKDIILNKTNPNKPFFV